jgi:hypothetical protein
MTSIQDITFSDAWGLRRWGLLAGSYQEISRKLKEDIM